MTDPTFVSVQRWETDNDRPIESYRQSIDVILKSWLDARTKFLN